MIELRFKEEVINFKGQKAIKPFLQYRYSTTKMSTSGVIGIPYTVWSEWEYVPTVKIDNKMERAIKAEQNSSQ